MKIENLIFFTKICPKLDKANEPVLDLELRFKHGIEAESHPLSGEKSPKEPCASAVNKWVNI